MSNTVITNYTDLNGPSTKADSSVVVIVNKDGSLSVDQNLLGTLMGTDGSQSAGISVVRVGHEGRPDDATDTESDEDDKIPHVTLTVDSYYNEPSSIIKYDSGAEMLQSLRIETRENSLIGFHNDHCYTSLTSPSQVVPQRERSESLLQYDEPVIQISHTVPPKPVPSSKKITILEQQIIPKGKKIQIKPTDAPIILKTNDVLNLNKPLPVSVKAKDPGETDKIAEGLKRLEESTESSSMSSSGESIVDRDSDSDYKDQKATSVKPKKTKLKPRILKSSQSLKSSKLDHKSTPKLKKPPKPEKKEIKRPIVTERPPMAVLTDLKKDDQDIDLESLLPTTKIAVSAPTIEFNKTVLKPVPKPVKKDKKVSARDTALLTDITALFSTPDVIRRVSTDNKPPGKTEKEFDKSTLVLKNNEFMNSTFDNTRTIEINKGKVVLKTHTNKKDSVNPIDKAKGCDLIPQIDNDSLAQILQDTEGISESPIKTQVSIAMGSPGFAGPLSPTLDSLLAAGLTDEEGINDDLMKHVVRLVENEKLQEVIDTQVLNVVPQNASTMAVQSPFQQAHSSIFAQKLAQKTVQPKKEQPIEIVRRDGRVITLPPIEAPATRSSKRKSQVETGNVSSTEAIQSPMIPAPPQYEAPILPLQETPRKPLNIISKQYVNKKLTNKRIEQEINEPLVPVKGTAESQESWNSEDDPYRLWCICKQPHNNRFMICCDSCEDWFHGKCVNITKAMGQQMEDQGIEWRCPNCIKKTKTTSTPKSANKTPLAQKKNESPESPMGALKSSLLRDPSMSKSGCIVCKKAARASSIYCSDACILKHAQDSLAQTTPTKSPSEPGKPQDKQKSDSRVIVYERKSGRLLAGPNAPTAENLKAWLQKNPTFEVVRPGALSSIKPGLVRKKPTGDNRIQTTLNFERVPKKSSEQSSPVRIPQSDIRDRRLLLSRRESNTPPPKPAPQKPNQIQLIDTPRPSTSTAKPVSEPRKIARGTPTLNRSQSNEKPPPSPSTSRRKEPPEKRKMDSSEPIRDNVRKSLQEQMSLRMKETKGAFTESDIQQFCVDTELELHDLFRDVGMKYKAKYRSLMFNIKDRKNLSLWEKICDKSITPQQLVRLSPDELASQELAEWRDQESKHQLELIKKSELDLLAASKTYVLKTHKGEEVMETKESVSTELDPNVPVEDLVTALNDSTVGEEVTREVIGEISKPKTEVKKESKNRKRERDASSSRSKKSRRNSSPAGRRKSRRDSDRKSRSSRRKSEYREKESKSERRSTRRSEKKSRTRSISRDRTKRESKEKSDSERPRHRSRSKDKVKRSKSRDISRSASKGRERSRSRGRALRRSTSKDRRRHRSQSKHASGDETAKLRSRSQDNVHIKNKTDSTDSDSVERPKSAQLKEPHPEYDPHEPMITSACSEEDLRKSEDVFEDTYKSVLESGIEYDPTKMFNLDSNILPTSTFENKDKAAAEAESDQEPSSTVDTAAATIWNGCINMVDVARFYVSAHEVSGSAMDLEEDLSAELDIVGRINPETVWDYLVKTRKASTKDIVMLRLQAANDEEKMQYIALYSYLSSRSRLGVVKVPNTASIKDFYIIPLPANTSMPSALLPINGPGLGDIKTHLLLAVIVRQKKKRLAANIPKDIIPAKVARGSRKRSYTPPVVGRSTFTPPSSPRRRVLPLPTYPASALSTSVKDKIAASLACADDEEAYSPGGSSSNSNSAPLPAVIAPPTTGPATNLLRTKMDELNRQIEEQKQQIMKMAQADSSVNAEDDEAYSPSRPMTPPPAVSSLGQITLPSNLHEILATIKQRSENPQPGHVDIRNLPLP